MTTTAAMKHALFESKSYGMLPTYLSYFSWTVIGNKYLGGGGGGGGGGLH